MPAPVSLQDYPSNSAARLLWWLYADILNFQPTFKGSLARTFVLGPWASAFFDLRAAGQGQAGHLALSGSPFYEQCTQITWTKELVLLQRPDGTLQNACYLPFTLPKEGNFAPVTLALRIRLRPGRAEAVAAALPDRQHINLICVGADGAPEPLPEGASPLPRFTLRVLDELPWEEH